jgi:Flp pilus assembly protein TadD
LRQFAIARSEPTDEFHQVQLREKPNDPEVHSNYGAYLYDRKRNADGAERAYRHAIELDDRCANALGNLANLMWKKGERAIAEEFYLRALHIPPQNENASYNYANFLIETKSDMTSAFNVVRAGVAEHKDSARLNLLHGELSLDQREFAEALAAFQRAREKDADQAQVARGLALALHLSGATIGECLEAYRLAITLNESDPDLHLNFAQLLFLKADSHNAEAELRKAFQLRLGDSALLEAFFYQLAHTDEAPAGVFAAIDACLARGGRFQWDLLANIELVRLSDAHKALLLDEIRMIMEGKRDRATLGGLLSRWPA